MTPEQQAIRQRIAAIDASYKHYSREYAYGIERTKKNLEYVQADCPHLDITSQYEISHNEMANLVFVRVCRDCQKVL